MSFSLNPFHYAKEGWDDVTNALGYQNPNNTSAGQGLAAQTGKGALDPSLSGNYGVSNTDNAKLAFLNQQVAQDPQNAVAANEQQQLQGKISAQKAAAQTGYNTTWQGTAQAATDQLGNPIAAPQFQQVAPWQQAQVQQAQAQTAQAAQAQAAQAQAATMQGAQLNTAQSDQQLANQNALTANLQATAAGQGPSVAQEQLRQATAANINQQMAAAQSAHGAARLAALRGATWNNAATQQTANSQAAGLRAQEIATAQGQLGNNLGTARGQDITTATQNAQLAQNTGTLNSGYQQSANLANAQLTQGMNQFNAGNTQQANLWNAGNQTQNSQFNAGAQNTSNLNFAQQQNAGNLSIGQANLNAGLNTNALNVQRANAYVGALQNSAQGITGIDNTLYGGAAAWNNQKQGIASGAVNGVANYMTGGASGALGGVMGGGYGSGTTGGLGSTTSNSIGGANFNAASGGYDSSGMDLIG